MKYLRSAAIAFFALSGAALAAESTVIGARGLGPAVFGMSLPQFARAIGEPLQAPQTPEDQACFYVESATLPGLSFMFEQNRLRRIDVTTERIATARGVRVGSSISLVKAKYGARVLDEPHHYSGPGDRYLTAQLSPTIAVRFETNGDRVSNFYVGGRKQVQYVEGCL